MCGRIKRSFHVVRLARLNPKRGIGGDIEGCGSAPTHGAKPAWTEVIAEWKSRDCANEQPAGDAISRALYWS
jgi:hypothetical protein